MVAAPPTPAVAAADEDPEHKNAKRLARIIASDIALYNQELMEEGIRKGNLLDLLKKDIEEGKELYVARIPEHVRQNTNYLKEAFQNLIETKKKQLGIK